VKRKTSGALYDATEGPIYFLASDTGRQRDVWQLHPYLLTAVTELRDQKARRLVEAWQKAGVKMLLDSGVFTFAMDYAREHDVPLQQALAMDPETADGFTDLFDQYVQIVQLFGAQSWGYIELDLGGRESKRRLRARLEGLGFGPIPVYHPMTDGPAYLDELAETYDRVCIGNLVSARGLDRVRLLATVNEAVRRHPTTWFHVLGVTPSETQIALRCHSTDSSSWIAPIKYPVGLPDRAMLKVVGDLDRNYQYVRGTAVDAPNGSQKSARMASVAAAAAQRTWRLVTLRMIALALEVDVDA
jgi:hypothetical protein